MAASDFELHFTRTGLAALPADVSCEATFTPDFNSATVASRPREETSGAAGHEGTLPRLLLLAPDAARDEGLDAAELVPVSVLGEGGMGRVLLARQHSLGREVAIKVLKGDQGTQGAAEALVAEARLTGSLEHPGVVPVYALARDARGLPALVMKRVDGVSWQALLHDDQHPAWKNVSLGRDRLEAHLEVLIQVCNAVAYAHRRGVIHRDLKPANVLIGELGEVYVADWGVAILKAGKHTGPPRLVGTPAYLAPEMVTGDDALVDERTDVYLLGAVLFEVLTLRPPHLAAGLREVLELAWVSAPPQFGPEVPEPLAQLCRKAMSANPAERFESVLQLRDGLRRFIEQRGSVRLEQAATVRLKTLESMAAGKPSEDEARRWHALVSECRFGFAQALEINPENASAAAGLERCLQVAVQRELERGNAGPARALLSELEQPSAELEQRVRALEAEASARTARDEKIRKIEHELDPAQYARERNVLMVLLAVTIAVAMTIGQAPFWAQALGDWARAVPMTLVTLVLGVCLAFGRKVLLATRINRQLTSLTVICCLFTLVSRFQSVLTRTPHAVVIAHDSLSLAAVMITCGFLLHWGFFVTGACFLVSALACMVAPGSATLIFGVAGSAGLVVSVLMLKHWLKTNQEQGILR